MNCYYKIIEGDLAFYSRISAVINSFLIIINIFQIIIILNVFINIKILSPCLLSKNIYYYLLFFYLKNIMIIIILEYFRQKNILFQSKKHFTIIISYIIVTFNIILISVLFPNLFTKFSELYGKNTIILYKKYNTILVIKLFFNLFIFVINIVIFKSYNYFTQENNDNNFDCKSFNSNSTCENENIIIDDINLNNENKTIIQKSILDKLNLLFINEYTQTD